MVMVSKLSIILGNMQSPNNSNLQIDSSNQMTGNAAESGDYSGGGCCNFDVCSLDPPEVIMDPLMTIPTDDPSLTILVDLEWPRRDCDFYIVALRNLMNAGHFRGKRAVLRNPTAGITKTTSGTSTTTTSPATTSTSSSTSTTTTTSTTSSTSTTTTSPATTSTSSSTSTTTTTSTTSSTSTTTTSPATTSTSSSTSTTTTTSTTSSTSTTTTSTSSSTSTTTTTSTTSSTSTTTTSPATTSTSSSTSTTTTSTTSSTSTTTTSTTSSTTAAPIDEDIIILIDDIDFPKVLPILEKDTSVEQRQALVAGEADLKLREEKELQIAMANITVEAGSSSGILVSAFKRTDPLARNISKLAVITTSATLEFQDIFSLPVPSIKALLLMESIRDCEILVAKFGPPFFKQCDPHDPYRTIDGSCNNVANILWGASTTIYRRDLFAAYNDGVSTFRRSIDGGELNSARLISTIINSIQSGESQSFSILHMTYGQFIDHDLVSTPIARGSPYGGGNGIIKCCDVPPRFSHPECAPIEIPGNDPFYRCYGQTCMEFVRSEPAIQACRFGPRNQLNAQTSYLDASVIYGPKVATTNGLRTFVDGRLKEQLTQDGQMLLPRDKTPDDGCNTPENIAKDEYCFKAGDGRANEQILLTFFQTLWAREHNRIAKILKECNPSWDDEKLFQEARRIVWAQLQQVTYKEFLPTIIGPTLMTSSKLYPRRGCQQTNDYNPFLDAGIANNFATAAYRFGHSLISDLLLSVTKFGKSTPRELSTLFFKPFELYQNKGMEDYARGGTNLPQKDMDSYFSLQVAGKLFRGDKPFGLDLLALNIQRGRDHGMQPYNKWRKYCGLKEAKTFNDLLDVMDEDRIKALKIAYRFVDDIDLYVGGVSENAIPGSILGHTFSCLIHNQFFRLKYGDRYWFEYKNGPGNFTRAQIKQLHRVTLARIMCNNLPELDYIQRWPLRNPGPDNPKVCCKSIRDYNLDPWKPDCPEICTDDDDTHEKPHTCCEHQKKPDCHEHEKKEECCCGNNKKPHHHDDEH